MNIPKPKTKLSRRIIITMVILVLLGGLATVYYVSRSGLSDQISSGQKTDQSYTSTGDLENPATDKNPKEDSLAQEETSPSTGEVSVVIVDASQYSDVFETRAYAHVVADGTCTYLFTNGSNTLTRTVKATAGPSTSSCTTVDIPVNEFAVKGSWQMTLTYKSDSGDYSGTVNRSVMVQ